MKGSFLLTRPNHELTTEYLFEWAKAVLEKARERGINVFDLSGKDATKEKFVKTLKRDFSSFIYLNGHGSPNEVTGYENKPVLKFADNEKLTKEKVVYALSCQSAKRLGKSCVTDGAKAYLGYNEDFIFVLDENKQETPLEDKTAVNFLQPSNNLVLSIIEGKTTGEAYQISQETFSQNIIKYSLSEATAEEKELLPYLLWDREHQVCLGSKETKCEFITEKEYKEGRRRKIIVGFFTAVVLLTVILVILLNRRIYTQLTRVCNFR